MQQDFIYINMYLSEEELNKWYEKISVYTVFKHKKLESAVSDSILVNTHLNVWNYMTQNDYKEQNSPSYKVLQKKDKYGSYLEHIEKKETLDELDKKLENQEFGRFKKLELYGMHSYSGRYSSFYPNLAEVIHLLYYAYKQEEFDFDEVERIYVTTEPYPNSDGYVCECFDYLGDRHRALTTCYIAMKKGKEKMKSNYYTTRSIKKSFMGIRKRSKPCLKTNY